ncbi:MAG: hypothetical protein K8H86_05370 [Ignavibacteriaceae bacterium]|nr:hypothetical protein [Ignavibacteriaceae bacterium]
MLKNFKKYIIKPSILVAVFAVLALMVIVSGYIEYKQSREELFLLMKEQAHSLLEVTLESSRNVISASESVEEELQQRVLDNAAFIKYLYDNNKLTDELLNKIAEEKGLHRILVFNKTGQKIFTSQQGMGHMYGQMRQIERDIEPILRGEKDTVVIGLKSNRFATRTIYAAALSAKNNSAIVINLDAARLRSLNKENNFSTLIKNITEKPGVVFFAVEDKKGIIVSSPDSLIISEYNGPPVENGKQDSIVTRITKINGVDVLEAMHTFFYNGNDEGLLRIGLSLEPLNNITGAALQRGIINAIILLFAGFVIFSLMFVRQNYSLLKKQYTAVETFSSGIIQTVSDAIIVYDDKNGIHIFNDAASKLFKKSIADVKGEGIKLLFDDNNCKALESDSTMERIVCRIDNNTKHLLISTSNYKDEENILHHILAIKDLTAMQNLEEQLKRRERLSAMGELASGVAHEIRNPLNAIGTIIQQLDKDFKPVDDAEEYHSLAKIVQKEIKRINETVTGFLRFSKPAAKNTSRFYISELFDQIKKQYAAHLSDNNINLEISNSFYEEVVWDKNQVLQCLINLIQNSVEALENNGHIKITARAAEGKEGFIEINIEDGGTGISEAIQQKIFNLYFTTKAKGTGIGLPLVQKIIDEHGGIIFMSSVPGKTVFSIQLPKETKV